MCLNHVVVYVLYSKLHSRRGGRIGSDVSKILNRRAQDPSQDPTEKLRGNFILKNYIGRDNLNLLKATPKLRLRFFMTCHQGAQYLNLKRLASHHSKQVQYCS